jgi:excisionase family DNA binding protein
MKDEAPSKLLRVSEVAEQLRVNPQTAYRWIREGTLAVRVRGAPRLNRPGGLICRGNAPTGGPETTPRPTAAARIDLS